MRAGTISHRLHRQDQHRQRWNDENRRPAKTLRFGKNEWETKKPRSSKTLRFSQSFLNSHFVKNGSNTSSSRCKTFKTNDQNRTKGESKRHVTMQGRTLCNNCRVYKSMFGGFEWSANVATFQVAKSSIQGCKSRRFRLAGQEAPMDTTMEEDDDMRMQDK